MLCHSLRSFSQQSDTCYSTVEPDSYSSVGMSGQAGGHGRLHPLRSLSQQFGPLSQCSTRQFQQCLIRQRVRVGVVCRGSSFNIVYSLSQA